MCEGISKRCAVQTDADGGQQPATTCINDDSACASRIRGFVAIAAAKTALAAIATSAALADASPLATALAAAMAANLDATAVEDPAAAAATSSTLTLPPRQLLS